MIFDSIKLPVDYIILCLCAAQLFYLIILKFVEFDVIGSSCFLGSFIW